MKVRVLCMSVVCIFFFVQPSFTMQGSSDNAASNFIVRAVAFGASSMVVGISFGVGFLGLFLSYFPVRSYELMNLQIGLLGVKTKSMFIGSLATYPVLLSLGVKNKVAAKASGSIFGIYMLLNSLSHWINLKRSDYPEKKWFAYMGASTGILGLATLAVSLRE